MSIGHVNIVSPLANEDVPYRRLRSGRRVGRYAVPRGVGSRPDSADV
jgi:hypothetical protein